MAVAAWGQPHKVGKTRADGNSRDTRRLAAPWFGNMPISFDIKNITPYTLVARTGRLLATFILVSLPLHNAERDAGGISNEMMDLIVCDDSCCFVVVVASGIQVAVE